MAPPPQPIHKQEHKSLLHHKLTSKEDEAPPVPCGNPNCSNSFKSGEKFCMSCGDARPKVKKTTKKLSAMEEDCVNANGCRHTVWLFLHTEVRPSPWILRHARRYEMICILFVLYLVLSDIIVSIPEMAYLAAHSVIYKNMEGFIYGVFTMEYLMRLWSCMESKKLEALGSLHGRLKLMSGVIEQVDLIVLIAYYINFIPGFDRLKGLQALRMIRLLRVAALLKVERKASSFSQILNVLKTKKSELMATLFTAIVLMVMSATTMYYLENEAQPETFGSVPDAMWWSVASLTTVGYGDVVPCTAAGKSLGAIVAFFGVGLFALPAGILGSGFVEEVEKSKRLAAKEIDEDEDVADEVMGEQEEEALTIGLVMEDVKSLRGTIDGLTNAQRDITNLLNTICPTLKIPPPRQIAQEDGSRPTTDKDLTALQDSISAKLERMRQARNGRELSVF